MKAYKKILKEFLGENTDKLCSDCQRRTDANPLRALDCKQQSCITLTEQAPVIIDHLCSDCSQHFNKVKEYLQMFKIPYQLNNRLVRGLDYYTRTVFEVVSNQLGAQNSLCGGGRYDGLIKLIGGKDTPAVGFAAGLERMLIVREEIGAELPAKKKPFVYLIGIGEEGRQEALKLLENLRQSGISADTDYKNKSLKSNFKEAAKLQIPYVIVIGEDEIKAGEVVLKDMEKGSQEKVKATELLELLLQKG